MRLAQLAWVDLSAQEWDLERIVHGLVHLVPHLEFVARFFIKDEGCVVERAVEVAILDGNRAAALLQACRLSILVLRLEEVVHRLRGLREQRSHFGPPEFRNRVFWRSLSIVVRTRHVRRVVLPVVVSRAIEKLSLRRINIFVVLGTLDVVETVPCKFAVNVSLPVHFGVTRHASSLDIVLLIWVELALGGQERLVPVPEILVEVLLVVLRVLRVEMTRRDVVSLVPPQVLQLSVARAILNNLIPCDADA